MVVVYLKNGEKAPMPDANHAMAGVTTYPFPIFGGAWAGREPAYFRQTLAVLIHHVRDARHRVRHDRVMHAALDQVRRVVVADQVTQCAAAIQASHSVRQALGVAAALGITGIVVLSTVGISPLLNVANRLGLDVAGTRLFDGHQGDPGRPVGTLLERFPVALLVKEDD